MHPHPRLHRLFHMTLLILVLILIGLKVLILVLKDDEPVLVLKDDEPVLVPSLIQTDSWIEIKANIKALLNCPMICNFYTRHFAQFPLSKQHFRREFTPSLHIWNFRQILRFRRTFLTKCNLTLAVSPTCPQHKPSAYLYATFLSQMRILSEIWIVIQPDLYILLRV